MEEEAEEDEGEKRWEIETGVSPFGATRPR